MLVRRLAVILAVMLCGVINLSAQHSSSCPPVKIQYDTLASCTIQFRHDKAAIDSNYLDNRTSLAAIRAALKEVTSVAPQSLASIVIEGYSSPVGNDPYNQRLSLQRAQKVEAFLRAIPGLETVDMVVEGKGEDWETFIKDVKAGYKRKNRKQVISILDSNISTYRKERKIKALEKDQTTWRYLVRNYMTGSRHAVTIVVVKKSRMLDIVPHVSFPIKLAEVLNKDTLAYPFAAMTSPSKQPTQSIALSKTPVSSIRTNLLVPALNVGAELPLGNRWSVAADYYYPWFWPNQKNKNCFEFLGASVEARYWFGRDRRPQDRLKGHSVGLYVAGGYYDFERNYRGMQGEFVSPGLDYTYSMAIGRQKNLHLQFTIAAGYIRSWGRTYNVYGDYGQLYPDEGTVIWDYVGPTKAAVTLVVPFYKKEGRR